MLFAKSVTTVLLAARHDA